MSVRDVIFKTGRTTHRLKSQLAAFEAVLAGRKRHEIRKDDRSPGFATGDLVVLHEWRPPDEHQRVAGFTGRSIMFLVGYVSREHAPPGWCAFDLIPLEEALRIGAAVLR